MIGHVVAARALGLWLAWSGLGFVLALALHTYRTPEMTWWLADWRLCG